MSIATSCFNAQVFKTLTVISKVLLLGLCTATATSAQAGDIHAPIHIEDAYARVSSPNAKVGAVFFDIENHADESDRLIAVMSDAAARVELHTHKENEAGVMQMLHIPEGIAIPAEGAHALKRGGDHVMLMGLTQGLEHGDKVPLTLVFEQAGEITLEVTVDLDRKPSPDAHGGHKHGARNH